MAEPEYLAVPPQEAIDHFRGKGYIFGFDWRDVDAAEHLAAFTVAKAMRIDILEDIREAVDRALAEGATFAQFQADVEPVLRRKGWWGRQEMVDPRTGARRVVQLGSPRRLRTILDTNLRTSTARGLWERIERTRDRMPYLRYVATLDSRTRPDHAQWHGTVLPAGHPWWRTHFPPNGWRCRCTVMQLSERDLERYGYHVSPDPAARTRSWTNKRTGETVDVPEGIDPGFAHNVGLVSPVRHADRILRDKAAAAPPGLAAAAAPKATGGDVRRAVERAMRDDARMASAVEKAAANAERANRAMAEIDGFVRRVGVRKGWDLIDRAAYTSGQRFLDLGDDLGAEARRLRMNYLSARDALRQNNRYVSYEVAARVRAELEAAGVEFGAAPAAVGSHAPTVRAVRGAVAKHVPARMVRAASERGPVGIRRSKARAHYDPRGEYLRSDGVDVETMVHEYFHHLQDRLVDVDADLRDLFWAAVRGERRRKIDYDRLRTQGGVSGSARTEAGYADELPDLYSGRTYLGRRGRTGGADAESPDELLAMLAQSLLHGDRWTLDWFRLQPAMVDAFLDAMLRESWVSKRHVMLDRWQNS